MEDLLSSDTAKIRYRINERFTLPHLKMQVARACTLNLRGIADHSDRILRIDDSHLNGIGGGRAVVGVEEKPVRLEVVEREDAA